MSNLATVGSGEAAQILGVSHRTLINRVTSGVLTPLVKLPGKTGAYVFNRTDVEALKETAK